MGSLAHDVSLAGYRSALHEYCKSVDFAFDSVAGEIITQRKPARYAGDSLRPLLVLWACAANGGDLTDALPVAAAFDLFDRFMLLHDELADEQAESIARWGLGQSLNAGDALYAVGFRCLANDVVDPQRRLRAAQIVAEALLDAVGARCNDRKGEAELTAAALHAGAVVAGASPERCEAFASAGNALGAALECTDEANAERAAMASAQLVRRCVDSEDYSEFLEAARYIARRNR
jgi:geranylgeranyl pyrophosphate synthase